MLKIIENTIKKIETMPTTNLKSTLAIVSAFITVLAYWTSEFVSMLFFTKQGGTGNQWHVDYTTLGVICAFIFSWLFDGRKQFEIKRSTDFRNSQPEPNGITIKT